MKKISFNDYIPEELADNESCRLITTEQYREYQQLKEENKPLSWEELKEEAKKMGYVQGFWENCITNGLFEFYKGGDIVVFGEVIAKKRTPDQMFAIMKALQ